MSRHRLQLAAEKCKIDAPIPPPSLGEKQLFFRTWLLQSLVILFALTATGH